MEMYYYDVDYKSAEGQCNETWYRIWMPEDKLEIAPYVCDRL